MKFCYCDESGTGDEPVAVMVGVITDAQRMHVTKKDWADLLQFLSKKIGRKVSEFHTRDFYAGNGVWRGVDGPTRASTITAIIDWLNNRKHDIIYTAVLKSAYLQSQTAGHLPAELNTIWRFMGLHMVLATQRAHQRLGKTRGHTVFVFDNEERERMRFTDIIDRPPPWSDEYYSRLTKAAALDQIIDVPYFGDSCEVGLLQLADCLAFFLRKYAEVKSGLTLPKYPDELARLEHWVKGMMARSVGRQYIYPAKGRGQAEEIFYSHAPACIREIA
jgi:hypothetical protein